MIPEMPRAIMRALGPVYNARILNYGSSTAEFYKQRQPFIWRELLQPLSLDNWVCNLDIKAADGVDVVVQVGESVPFADGHFDVVLCNSLLEHVEDPGFILDEIHRVLDEDGRMVADVPADYPYHPDPIDTMLRLKTREDWEALLGSGWIVDSFQRIGSASMVVARKA